MCNKDLSEKNGTNCRVNDRFVAFPGADIIFANSVLELHKLPKIYLADGWDGYLRKTSILRKFINGNIEHYLDLDINKRKVPNLIGTINLSNKNCLSFSHGKKITVDAAKENVWVLLPANEWFKVIHLYITVGFRKFAILPALGNIGSVRFAIAAKSRKIAFLPNYKVMYSSIRDFMRNEISEFKNLGSHPGALNRLFDMEQLGSRVFSRFSIVRNPYKRVVSAFMDKFMRENPLEREKYFSLSTGTVMAVDKVNFSDYIRFIYNVPDTHSDPHWISQYGKLYDGDKCLVDYIGHYECKDKFIENIYNLTGLELHKLQNTNPGPGVKNEFRIYEQYPECYDMITMRYNTDIVNLNYE